MKCLLKYQWVKLPRTLIPRGQGIMGSWSRLASRAAFRAGQAQYCGYINEVTVGSWAGGVVGLKSILKQKSRAKTLDTMNSLSHLGYINYHLNTDTKKLTYKINDFVVKCSGEACMDGAVYATEGYGFLCIPRSITQRLIEQHYKFDDSDAWLDLWCHTVWRDPGNAFSYMAPTIQIGKYGAALTLETLGQRWKWEKTKVWRFLQKNKDAFTLHKLPGSYGCLIFNTLYPTDTEFSIPKQAEIIRILSEMRIQGKNAHEPGSYNDRINRLITWYSKNLHPKYDSGHAEPITEDRVAHSAPIIRAYFSPCRNCKNCVYDCRKVDFSKYSEHKGRIRGPCINSGPT